MSNKKETQQVSFTLGALKLIISSALCLAFNALLVISTNSGLEIAILGAFIGLIGVVLFGVMSVRQVFILFRDAVRDGVSKALSDNKNQK